MRAAGYGELWDKYRLRIEGIVHLRYPIWLVRATVLTPESAEPNEGSAPYYRLTPAQHRELLTLMFGEDPGLGASGAP